MNEASIVWYMGQTHVFPVVPVRARVTKTFAHCVNPLVVPVGTSCLIIIETFEVERPPTSTRHRSINHTFETENEDVFATVMELARAATRNVPLTSRFLNPAKFWYDTWFEK
jgi:hypothetical protein